MGGPPFSARDRGSAVPSRCQEDRHGAKKLPDYVGEFYVFAYSPEKARFKASSKRRSSSSTLRKF